MLWNINLQDIVKLRISDQERSICVPDDIGHLICRQAIVYGEENSTKIAGGAGNFDKGWTVLHENSDNIPLADPLLRKKPGELPDTLPQRAVADTALLINNGCVFRLALRMVFQKAAEIDHFKILSSTSPG